MRVWRVACYLRRRRWTTPAPPVSPTTSAPPTQSKRLVSDECTSDSVKLARDCARAAFPNIKESPLHTRKRSATCVHLRKDVRGERRIMRHYHSRFPGVLSPFAQEDETGKCRYALRVSRVAESVNIEAFLAFPLWANNRTLRIPLFQKPASLILRLETLEKDRCLVSLFITALAIEPAACRQIRTNTSGLLWLPIIPGNCGLCQHLKRRASFSTLDLDAAGKAIAQWR